MYCGVCGGRGGSDNATESGAPIDSSDGLGAEEKGALAFATCRVCSLNVHQDCLPLLERESGQDNWPLWTCRNCRNGGGLTVEACCKIDCPGLLRVPYLLTNTLHQHEICRRAHKDPEEEDDESVCEVCGEGFDFYSVTCGEDGCDTKLHPSCAHTHGCQIVRTSLNARTGCNLRIFCSAHSGDDVTPRLFVVTSPVAQSQASSSQNTRNLNRSCFLPGREPGDINIPRPLVPVSIRSPQPQVKEATVKNKEHLQERASEGQEARENKAFSGKAAQPDSRGKSSHDVSIAAKIAISKPSSSGGHTTASAKTTDNKRPLESEPTLEPNKKTRTAVIDLSGDTGYGSDNNSSAISNKNKPETTTARKSDGSNEQSLKVDEGNSSSNLGAFISVLGGKQNNVNSKIVPSIGPALAKGPAPSKHLSSLLATCKRTINVYKLRSKTIGTRHPHDQLVTQITGALLDKVYGNDTMRNKVLETYFKSGDPFVFDSVLTHKHVHTLVNDKILSISNGIASETSSVIFAVLGEKDVDRRKLEQLSCTENVFGLVSNPYSHSSFVNKGSRVFDVLLLVNNRDIPEFSDGSTQQARLALESIREKCKGDKSLYRTSAPFFLVAILHEGMALLPPASYRSEGVGWQQLNAKSKVAAPVNSEIRRKPANSKTDVPSSAQPSTAPPSTTTSSSSSFASTKPADPRLKAKQESGLSSVAAAKTKDTPFSDEVVCNVKKLLQLPEHAVNGILVCQFEEIYLKVHGMGFPKDCAIGTEWGELKLAPLLETIAGVVKENVKRGLILFYKNSL